MLFLLHPKTRGRYLKYGKVYTLRANRRKRVGPDCIAASRNPHVPLGKGLVSLEKTFKKLSPAALKPYLRQSGFKNAADWMEAYASYTKGKITLPAYLYQVQRLADPSSKKKA